MLAFRDGLTTALPRVPWRWARGVTVTLAGEAREASTRACRAPDGEAPAPMTWERSLAAQLTFVAGPLVLAEVDAFVRSAIDAWPDLVHEGETWEQVLHAFGTALTAIPVDAPGRAWRPVELDTSVHAPELAERLAGDALLTTRVPYEDAVEAMTAALLRDRRFVACDGTDRPVTRQVALAARLVELAVDAEPIAGLQPVAVRVLLRRQVLGQAPAEWCELPAVPVTIEETTEAEYADRLEAVVTDAAARLGWPREQVDVFTREVTGPEERAESDWLFVAFDAAAAKGEIRFARSLLILDGRRTG